jgi:hypothetical protein
VHLGYQDVFCLQLGVVLDAFKKCRRSFWFETVGRSVGIADTFLKDRNLTKTKPLLSTNCHGLSSVCIWQTACTLSGCEEDQTFRHSNSLLLTKLAFEATRTPSFWRTRGGKMIKLEDARRVIAAAEKSIHTSCVIEFLRITGRYARILPRSIPITRTKERRA